LVSGEKFPHLNIRAERFLSYFNHFLWAQGDCKNDMLVRMAGCSYEYEENAQRCTLSFTASCGLAEFTRDESAEELLRRADEALYVAKRTGKNRVVLAKKSKSWWKTLKPFKRGGTDR
jgi:GGDEF domain-containing protein